MSVTVQFEPGKNGAEAIKKPVPLTVSETGEHSSWQRATLPPRDVAVASPLKGLTAVFGMGTGVAPSLSHQENTFKTAQHDAISLKVKPSNH